MLGTAAIHLALLQLGVAPGDEVICQSFTFAASANPIRYLGASPVFVDSRPDHWNMDPELLEVALADRIRVTGRQAQGGDSCAPVRDACAYGWYHAGGREV